MSLSLRTTILATGCFLAIGTSVARAQMPRASPPLPAPGNQHLAPSPSSADLQNRVAAWLCLNAFRGEPASSGFDWHFTPIHSSSADFSTSVGSDLYTLLHVLHPDHA